MDILFVQHWALLRMLLIAGMVAAWVAFAAVVAWYRKSNRTVQAKKPLAGTFADAPQDVDNPSRSIA